MRQLLLRTVTAVLALSLTLCLVWMPGLRLFLAAFVGLLACIGLYEFYSMARARSLECETAGGLVAGVAVALSGSAGSLAAMNFTLFAGVFFVALLHLVRGRHSVAGLAASVFGIVYVGWMGAHVLLLHSLPGAGPCVVTLLLAAMALNDSGAYLAGISFGKRKLAPAVSPNKTWEGSVAGLAATVLGMGVAGKLCATGAWDCLSLVPMPFFLVAGVVLSIVGQIGDLIESLMKRDAGVKDSGALFPGHGGVLDRCDSLLFAAPVFYYMIMGATLWFGA